VGVDRDTSEDNVFRVSAVIDSGSSILFSVSIRSGDLILVDELVAC